MKTLLRCSALFLSVVAVANLAAASRADWHVEFPPVNIAGNLYYVGTADLAIFERAMSMFNPFAITEAAKAEEAAAAPPPADPKTEIDMLKQELHEMRRRLDEIVMPGHLCALHWRGRGKRPARGLRLNRCLRGGLGWRRSKHPIFGIPCARFRRDGKSHG